MDDDYSDYSDEELAGAALDHAVAAGADVERIVETASRYVNAGYDPVGSLGAAAELHDHSEAKDELEALDRIAWREGWE